MSGRRFLVDCFIPESVWAAIPSATKTAIRDRIRQLKSFAVKVSEREETVKATWHVCYHDEAESKPCEPEQAI